MDLLRSGLLSVPTSSLSAAAQTERSADTPAEMQPRSGAYKGTKFHPLRTCQHVRDPRHTSPASGALPSGSGKRHPRGLCRMPSPPELGDA